MTTYLYFQSIVNYRIPMTEKGLGSPEVTNKFTREVKGTHKKRPNKQVALETQEIEEGLF